MSLSKSDSRYLKYILHNSFALTVFMIMAYFIIVGQNPKANMIYYTVMSAIAGNYLLLYLTKSIEMTLYIASLVIIIAITYLVYLFPFEARSVVWVMIVPFFIYIVNGHRVGTLFTLIYLLLLSTALKYGHESASFSYDYNFYSLMIALALLSFFIFLFERNRHHYLRATKRLHRKEKHQRERLSKALVELNRYKQNLEVKVEAALMKRQQDHQILIQQSKMAAMGEMLSAIAHQWRQPLAVQSATLSLMEIQLKTEGVIENIDEEISVLQQQLEFMSQTIDDFRRFFDPDRKKGRFTLLAGVDEIMKLFARHYQHDNVSIRILDSDEVFVEGYFNEYCQVLLNLFNNARDVMVGRGPIEREITIEIYSEEQMGVIIIEDSGGGIAEDVMNKIFTPYFTTKGTKGTGIGLYMSKGIIEESMRGLLSVENGNRGARFTIKLPRSPV